MVQGGHQYLPFQGTGRREKKEEIGKPVTHRSGLFHTLLYITTFFPYSLTHYSQRKERGGSNPLPFLSFLFEGLGGGGEDAVLVSGGVEGGRGQGIGGEGGARGREGESKEVKSESRSRDN